eukprot:TRINITY_DN13634_c0_g1_i2.p2 TRINITY_DN13634_c0_g1~~TRINITY_DN13634_c0_g1_i2.p2  ORF type:complete len:143 (-),score=26.82 TRINITY_DN13634_c0_g1_i2:18-446(-)
MMSSGQTLGVKAQRFRGHTSPHRNVKEKTKTKREFQFPVRMGSCCSTGYWNTQSKVKPYPEIEPSLQCGDVVLLAGNGPSQYIMKVDRWSAFSICGYIIRDAPGTHGLVVVCSPPIEQSSSNRPPSATDYRLPADRLVCRAL